MVARLGLRLGRNCGLLLRADGDLLRADCECGRWGKHPWCVAWRRLLCNLLGCWLLRKRMGLRLLRRRLLNNWLALWLLLGRLGRRWLNLRHGRLLLNRWLLCHWLLHRGLLCPKKVRETEGCFCNWLGLCCGRLFGNWLPLHWSRLGCWRLRLLPGARGIKPLKGCCHLFLFPAHGIESAYYLLAAPATLACAEDVVYKLIVAHRNTLPILKACL